MYICEENKKQSNYETTYLPVGMFWVETRFARELSAECCKIFETTE